jgi:hypothetical protein
MDRRQWEAWIVKRQNPSESSPLPPAGDKTETATSPDNASKAVALTISTPHCSPPPKRASIFSEATCQSVRPATRAKWMRDIPQLDGNSDMLREKTLVPPWLHFLPTYSSCVICCQCLTDAIKIL